MPSEDIRDLLGRYATGTLSETERQRLFDAALDDQELFEELARELQLKQLLDEPGARDRMIRALEPPRRRLSWILVMAPIAASLAVLLAIFIMRPAPKPVQIAAVEPAPKTVSEPANQPKPSGAPAAAPVRMKQEPAPPPAAPPAVERKAKDAEAGDKVSATAVSATEVDTVQLDEKKVAAPPPTPARERLQQRAFAQQAPGGPKQNAVQNARQAAGATVGSTVLPVFGFHYSVATKGHLIIVPLADGYLSIKTNDGAILAAQKPIAAAITIDIPVPDAATSVAVVFTTTATPADAPAVSRDATEATVQGATTAAVTIQLKK